MMRQKDLVAALGVQQRMVTRWENDEAAPRPQTLEKIATVLGVSLDELLSQAHGGAANVVLDDPELQELVEHLPELLPPQRDALKQIIRDMLTCKQFQELAMSGRRSNESLIMRKGA